MAGMLSDYKKINLWNKKYR